MAPATQPRILAGMQYYEVFVAEQRYQKQEPLTYSFAEILQPGQLVSVPYGKREVLGFVQRETIKPSFAAKSITEASAQCLPRLSTDLHAWMLDYYPYGAGSITQLFMPSDALSQGQAGKITEKKHTAPQLPPLTNEQLSALQQLTRPAEQTHILHGETGSGKTRLYLELTKAALETGTSALILTPEISLTPQLVETFQHTFGDKVITIHSGITKATRRKQWQRILSAKEPLIIIGTRSALFAPLQKIGLVVIDEMHEPAYKQDSAPRYHALRVAATIARLHYARLVYGSATPSITDYYLASQKNIPVLRLTEQAKKTLPVTKSIIDLKNPSLFSRDRYLSDPLIDAIGVRLAKKEQSLLFLNRRGTARQIICKDCGWQALCPKCDLPLTFHADSHNLRCHTCGHTQSPPFSCPDCQSGDISYRSLGTKALADLLLRLFPEARVARFDTDNLAHESLAHNFERIKSGDIDIIIGTQMLGKGLDLPLLSLVGIINADTSLSMPDFSSTERNYQLIHQAIGRVGRGHRPGEVILQTFRPDDPFIRAALDQNWEHLYTQELAERNKYLFPPYAFLLKLVASRSTPDRAEAYLEKLKHEIHRYGLGVRVEEPTPCFYEKSYSKYNWQLVVKAKSRPKLVDIVKRLPAGDYSVDIDPLNLL